MDANRLKNRRLLRRKRRIRKTAYGTADRPRLSVFRSSKHIYAQIINDDEGRTLLAASSLSKELNGGSGPKSAVAESVGRRLAEMAEGAGIKRVLFDRNGRKFHGRIKALAEAMRQAGMEF